MTKDTASSKAPTGLEFTSVNAALGAAGVASLVAGYWLLGQDRIEEAIRLFELNVELYPEAWNVYDSLGEAQLEAGLRSQGLANYRRSLELNPENDNARRVLADAGVLVY